MTLGVVGALAPAVALACPVCFTTADARVLRSYYLSAALLTLMPFVAAGVIGGWLLLRTRRRPGQGDGSPHAAPHGRPGGALT